MGLMAADGRTNKAIAPARGTDPNPVDRGRRRLAERGLEGRAQERPRGGHPGGPCSKAPAELRRRATPTEAPEAPHESGRTRGARPVPPTASGTG